MSKVKRFWPAAVVVISILVMIEWRPWHTFSGPEKVTEVELPVKEDVVLEAGKEAPGV